MANITNIFLVWIAIINIWISILFPIIIIKLYRYSQLWIKCILYGNKNITSTQTTFSISFSVIFLIVFTNTLFAHDFIPLHYRRKRMVAQLYERQGFLGVQQNNRSTFYHSMMLFQKQNELP